MAKKVYLVDTENVGASWKYLFHTVSNTDEILLFYTENTPFLSYTDLDFIFPFKDRFTMIKCYTGNNALDFQLVSYLGYLMKTGAKTQYIIVSNDTGYDAMVHFWTDRERSVSRLSSVELVRSTFLKSAPAAENKALVQEKASEASPEKDKQESEKKSTGRTKGRRQRTNPPHSSGSVEEEAAEKGTMEETVEPVKAEPSTTENEGKTEPAKEQTDTEPNEMTAEVSAKEPLQEGTVNLELETAASQMIEPEVFGKEEAEEAEAEAEAKPARRPSSRRRTSVRKAKENASTENPPESATAEIIQLRLTDLKPETEGIEVDEEPEPGTFNTHPAVFLQDPGVEYTDGEILIQSVLSDVKEMDIIQWIAEMLQRHDSRQLQQIHREFVKKYGQAKGGQMYKLVKPIVRQFYSLIKEDASVVMH